MDVTELTRLEIAYCVELDRPGNPFQRRARLLQSIWRAERGHEVGRYLPRGCTEPRPLGSRLPTAWAKETLANYLTETIRDVVRSEVLDPVKSRGKVYGRPRIFDNLLSSQPLAFNLFGELQKDLELTTTVMRDLTGGRVDEVTGIKFEHSPGRGDSRYTGDHSAFDVFIEFTTPGGKSGFLGIEVKYHEDLKGGRDCYRVRYAEVAELMGCFEPAMMLRLRTPRLEQIWRDHLLAGSMRIQDGDKYEDGLFVLLRPRDNIACATAVNDYRACLSNENSFSEWLLEDVMKALMDHTNAKWVRLFFDRYLAFDKVDTELAAASRHG